MNRGPEPPASDIVWLINTYNVVKDEKIVEHDYQILILARRWVSITSQLTPFPGNIATDLIERHDTTRAVIPDQ